MFLFIILKKIFTAILSKTILLSEDIFWGALGEGIWNARQRVQILSYKINAFWGSKCIQYVDYG